MITPNLYPASLYPAIYQINTRIRSDASGKLAHLNDFSDTEIDQLAEQGFEWVWLLGVWQTGPAGQHVSRTEASWQKSFRESLPDFVAEDVGGSCFAITHYRVDTRLGGNAALQALRRRFHARGLRLMLDFVPNHTALDHPWVKTNPTFFMRRTAAELANEPQNHIALDTNQGEQVFAFGRDPHFSGWPDTLQLDYSNRALQAAMQAELQKSAKLCDGLRCDMAMLVLPEIFQKTWGQTIDPFWPAALASVRSQFPDFLFLAEVYWNLEWTMQQQGFDYAYDKRLYDRLRDQNAPAVREHLLADLSYQNQLTRFLENHDERRAAATFVPQAAHQAAALISFLAPGMRFFHEGQLEGNLIHTSIHLSRSPKEPIDPSLSAFYQQLLQLLKKEVLRNGQWQLLECAAAWEGNPSCDHYIAYQWQATDGVKVLVVVNYAAHQGQCRVRLPDAKTTAESIDCIDLFDMKKETVSLDLSATDGLLFDLPAWSSCVFQWDDRQE